MITAADPAALQDKLSFKLRTPAGTQRFEGGCRHCTRRRGGARDPTDLTGEFMAELPAGKTKFHLNLGWRDHDRPQNTKPSVLWWRDNHDPRFGEYTLRP